MTLLRRPGFLTKIKIDQPYYVRYNLYIYIYVSISGADSLINHGKSNNKVENSIKIP